MAKKKAIQKTAAKDRRKAARYNTRIAIDIRLMFDGAPILGSAVEIGPNGMRILTPMPLVEASYVHIRFRSASNNTGCEGRIVWTLKSTEEKEQYESGVDIQKWGGDVPGNDVVQEVPFIRHKRDRRRADRK